jgi:hypothetical protein
MPGWTGGSASWFSTQAINGVGWDSSIPTLSTDASILQQNITVSVSSGSAAARSLSMQGGGTGIGSNSALINISGGSLTLGTGSPVGNVTQTAGTIEFKNAVVNPDSSLDFTHAGTPGTNSSIFNLLQSQGGTILIDSGSLSLSGSTIDVAGTIGGAGTLSDPIAGAVTLAIVGSATIEASASFNVTTFSVTNTNANITLNSDRTFGMAFKEAGQTTVNLNGHTVTLNGAVNLDGSVQGAGTMILASTATVTGAILGGGATLDVEGMVTNTNGFNTVFRVGQINTDANTLQIGANGTWNIINDAGMTLSAASTFSNAGLFEKTAGTGYGINGGTISNTGTIKSNSGVIAFIGGSGTFGGHLTGTGEIDIGGDGGHYTLANGVVLDVAKFGTTGTGATLTFNGDLVYGGAFTGGALILNGHTLTLNGTATIGGSVQGAGTMVLGGTTTLTGTSFSGGMVLDDEGTLTETNGFFTVVNIGSNSSDTSMLKIGAGATWNIINDAGMNLSAAATLNNAGLLEKTAGTGFGINGGTIDNTGTVKSTSGVLSFAFGTGFTNDGSIVADGGTVKISGAITGAGSATIANGGTFEIGSSDAQNVTFAGEPATLRLDSPTQFTGHLLGMGNGDAIFLPGVQVSSATLNGSTLSIVEQGGPTLTYALSSHPAGATFAVGNTGAGATMTMSINIPAFQGLTTPEQQAEALYVAFFDRGGDVAGINYWVRNFDQGQNISDLALNFSKSGEAQALYPFLANDTVDSQSNRVSFINSIYNDLFARNAEGAVGDQTTGLGYWEAQLHQYQTDFANGKTGVDTHGSALNAQDYFSLRVATFVVNVVGGAQNSNAGQDITAIQNKVTVAGYFKGQVAGHNVAWDGMTPASVTNEAKLVVNGTNATQSSVTSQEAAIDSFFGGHVGAVGIVQDSGSLHG